MWQNAVLSYAEMVKAKGGENLMNSKFVIRVKNSEYPYFTEELVGNGDFYNFTTINKQGVTRKVQLAKSEVISIEETQEKA